MKHIFGDLIHAAKSGDVNIIAHGCNCQNTMKSGIAPHIASAFPSAFRADQATTKGNRNKLGLFTVGEEPSGILVYNLYTQFGFWERRKGGRDLDYNALYNSLSGMAEDIRSRFTVEEICDGTVKIGMPKIGAGLAGGDWRIIENMIDVVFERNNGLDITIYSL